MLKIKRTLYTISSILPSSLTAVFKTVMMNVKNKRLRRTAMKKMLSALLVALSMSIAPAYAHVCDKMHDKLEKIAMKLELSKEQRDQIHAINTESKQKLMPLRDELKAVRQRVNEAFRANTMNMFKLNSFTREEKEVIGKMIKIRMDERYKINQLLTEKQRIQFADMVEHWKKEHHKKAKH